VAGRGFDEKVVETKMEPLEVVEVVAVPIGREASRTPEIVEPFAVTLAGFAVKRR
jgi:hypothetical protein